MVFETGAARWLAWVLLGGIVGVPTLLQPFVIVLAVAGLHLMFSSNTVTASIIVPILVALARDLGLDVWTIVAPAAFASSLAFILVSEGPTTIIPYSSGYFSIKDMAKAGVCDDRGRGARAWLLPYALSPMLTGFVESERGPMKTTSHRPRRSGTRSSIAVRLRFSTFATKLIRRAHPLFAASLPLGRLELEIYDRVPRLDHVESSSTTKMRGLAEAALPRSTALGYSNVAASRRRPERLAGRWRRDLPRRQRSKQGVRRAGRGKASHAIAFGR